jgi:hypothetical protein
MVTVRMTSIVTLVNDLTCPVIPFISVLESLNEMSSTVRASSSGSVSRESQGRPGRANYNCLNMSFLNFCKQSGAGILTRKG